MNKNVCKAFILCALFSFLQISASDRRDSEGCFTTSPYLPSSYLKGWAGIGANVAVVATVAAAVCLSTKSGRAFAGNAVGSVAKSTSAGVRAHGPGFVCGALVGGAAVNSWYQRVGEPELVAETRGQDFTRDIASQDASGAKQ